MAIGLVSHSLSLYRKPFVGLKDVNTPSFIKLRFSCNVISTCPRCSLSAEEKRHYKQLKLPLPFCPFSQYLLFQDSISMVPFGLGQIIDDLRDTAAALNIEKSKMFPSVYGYLKSLGLSDEAQEMVAHSKMSFPFEQISRFSSLLVTTPPEKEAFSSLLKGKDPDLDKIHLNFVSVWQALGAKNMLDIFRAYVKLDSAFTADALHWYFERIQEVTGCYATHYRSISSLAMDSALKNSTDPIKKNDTVQLPMLSERIYDIFAKMLKGGLATVFAHKARFNNGLDLEDDCVTFGSYVDANGLYPAILSGSIPHSGFTIFSQEENSTMFDYLCKKLRCLDTTFFLNMARKNMGYVFDVVVSFALEEVLPTNIELCSLPYLKEISDEHLSSDQADAAIRMGRRLRRERPKLVTSLEPEQEVTDFVQNILYMIIFHGLRLVKISSVICFRSYPYFNNYIQKLQTCRRDSQSKILGKVIKSLGRLFFNQISLKSAFT